MKRKSLLSGITLLLVGVLFGSLWGTSGVKPIRAQLNPTYKYTFNGSPILKDVPAIIYKNSAYVPLFDLAKALGYNVKVTDKEATLTSPQTKPTPVTPSVPADSATLEKAQVVAINFANNVMTVLPAGKVNKVENLIDLVITPETTIQDSRNKKTYTLSELEPGINVKVVHSTAFTKSIPPQTVAYSITLL